MIRVIPAVLLTGSAMIGTAAGNFIEDHTVSLSTLIGVGTVVLPATWWISRRLTKIDDRNDAADKRIADIDLKTVAALNRLEAALNRLPCEQRRCEDDAKRAKNLK